jgi:hypothetical protein
MLARIVSIVLTLVATSCVVPEVVSAQAPAAPVALSMRSSPEVAASLRLRHALGLASLDRIRLHPHDAQPPSARVESRIGWRIFGGALGTVLVIAGGVLIGVAAAEPGCGAASGLCFDFTPAYAGFGISAAVFGLAVGIGFQFIHDKTIVEDQ